MNASRLQMMSNCSAKGVSRTSPRMKLTSLESPSSWARSRRDGDHLLGEVDARDLGAVGLRQVERRAADPAADVEHAHAGPQRSCPAGGKGHPSSRHRRC